MKLMEHLPEQIYNNEKHVEEFQNAVEQEIIRLQEARDELFLQTRPATSTWGMAHYEREYAIQPNEQKPHAQRLSAWRAKRRGRGTTTAALIKSMADSYSPASTEVSNDYKNSLVELKIPYAVSKEYIQELLAGVREILPAHLDLAFRTINTWEEVIGLHTWGEYIKLTWGDLLNKTWGRILGDRTWEEVLGYQQWEDYEEMTWGDLSEQTWAHVVYERTWSDVYNYRGTLK